MSEISDEATQAYLEGLKLFGEQKHREAIEAYERSLAAAPDWTEVLHGIAMALMYLEEYDQAIEVGLRICELDAGDAFAHTSLSMFYQRKSAVAEAAGEEEAARELIDLAEKEGAKARMLSWKEELKKNPNAAPPGPAGSMDVIQ
jgi:tetratricopeptide (TPR) repeat protein